MAEHTGQPIEVIERDTERDRFMDAEQSREYGLIDEVIVARGSAARDRPHSNGTGGCKARPAPLRRPGALALGWRKTSP
jgi:hypothetical protein